MELFKKIIGSFYSKDLYRDAAKKWKGVAFSYLFILVVVLSITVAIKYCFVFDAAMENDIVPYVYGVVSDMPEVKITKGEVSINKPVPYIIKDAEGETVFVIDTSGKNKDYAKVPVVLKKNKLFVMKSEYETRSFDLSKIDDFTMNKNIVNDWIAVALRWAPFVVYPFIVVFMILFGFALRIIQVLFHALISQFFAGSLYKKIDYSVSLRLAIVSITPALVVGMFFNLLSIGFPYLRFILFLMTMGYLYYGVKVNS